MENGLSIIEKPKQNRGSYGTWIGDEKQPTLWESLAELIDANLEQSLTLEELKDALRKVGCEVKHKAHLAVKLPQGKRFIRPDSLGENYTEHELLKRLGCEQIVKPTAKKKALSPAGNKPNLLIDIEAKLQQGKGVGYEKWAKTFKDTFVLGTPFLQISHKAIMNPYLALRSTRTNFNLFHQGL